MIEVFWSIGVNCGTTDALDLRKRADGMTGTAIINEEEKIPKFENKDYTEYPVGSPVMDGVQVLKLIQPYNATVQRERPLELRALWSLCHTTNPLKAKPWVNAHGTSGMYMKDECYIDDDGKVWQALQDNLVYDAKGLPSAWKEVIFE